MKPLRWRIFFVLALTLWAIYAVAPTFIYFAQTKEVRNNPDELAKKIPSWLPKKHILLGLDLQGGGQYVLGVKLEEAIVNRLARTAVELKRWAEEKDLPVETSYVDKDTGKLTVVLKDESAVDKFREAFKAEYSHLAQTSRKNNVIYYGYSQVEMERITKSALEQVERVIHNRIDALGVTEPMINRRQDGSILLQMPGFSDTQRAKELLGRTAQLKFKIVRDDFTGFNAIDLKNLPAGISSLADEAGSRAFVSENREQLAEFLKPHVPADREVLFEGEQLGDGTQARYRWTSHVVDAATVLSGDDIMDAHVAQGSGLDHRPIVVLKFTPSGGKFFAKLTGENVKKRMAIVLDGKIESAPTINERISGGTATITLGGRGAFQEQMDEATQLALVLKSGAIPASIDILEERQVGASLGPELANQGIKGILVGLVCVLAFMLIYYRRPGGIACIALLLNALLLLACMAGFGFALSLPGIAGFVLTLGMAVDANVLINERIRQEIYEGRHPRKAVEGAFKKVFWTIIDANLTTIIAALVLLETNPSGPIRGFAVTLMIGLLVSLFTALYCTRLFFDMVGTQVGDQDLRAWLGAPKQAVQNLFKFDFLKAGSVVTGITVLISVLTLGTAVVRGVNFGVDFAGGTEAMIGFTSDTEADDIYKIAEKSKLEGVSLQALDGGKKQYLLRYDERLEGGQKLASTSEVFLGFKQNLMQDLADHKPEVLQVNFVGPQVGQELRTQGILSVLYAILAVILYIAFRFDMRFSPGAFAKMFLDVFVMLGFYVFFWASFDLVAVAAFLTVVGYSVNDVIVIYDRIRENLLDHPRRDLRDNINISINETFVRSINTSVTTVVSLFGILIFGSGQIWNFAMAMTVGVVAATISSTFVATSFVYWFERWKRTRPTTGPASSSQRANA